MLGSFWTSIAGKLGDRWASMSAPALVFWAGGLLAWIVGHGGTGRLAVVTNWLNRQTVPVQITAVLVGLLALGASALVVDRVTTPTLRALEGYWPSALSPLRARLVAGARRRALDDEAEWQALAPKVLETGSATPDELARFAALDAARRRRPNDLRRLMPTRIGNVLRAAETWPADKYGLDAVAVWPRLWLVLPELTRREIALSRTALDGAVAAGVWGLLFCAFAVWTLLAIPIGLAVAASAGAIWVPARATRYGDLVEAAYDVHRVELYRQLRWPLPGSPAEEPELGRRLTTYLWRGSDAPEPRFAPPS